MRISSICRVLYNPLAAIFDHQLFEKEEYIRLLHMGVGKAPVCNEDKGYHRVLAEIPFPSLELLLVDLATGIALA